MKKNPFLYFSLLACLFGWSLFILAALGVKLYPTGMPLGPMLAAIVVVIAGGRDRWTEWRKLLFAFRAPAKWYLLALVVPVIMVIIPVFINHLFGAPLPDGNQWIPGPAILVNIAFMFIFVGIGEETGWTAFMAPELLKKNSLILTWVILAAVRFTWHIPLMIQAGGSRWLDLALGIVAFQFVILWVYKRGGNVWILAAIWHTVNNIMSQFFGPMVQGADHDRLGVLKGVAYVFLAIVIYLVDRKFLKGKSTMTENARQPGKNVSPAAG